MTRPDADGDRRAEPEGLVCPRCGCAHWLVVYTRRRPGGTILRRRECRHCGRRILTVERPAGKVPPM